LVITQIWYRSLKRLPGVLLGSLLIVLMLVAPAAARNVPGSAAIAQTAIDSTVGSAILDSVLSYQDMPLCDVLDEPEDGRWEEPCTIGLSIGGGFLTLQDAPDGYQFDYRAAYSSLILTQRLSGGATIFGGLIGEAGAGVLVYNDGTLTHYGAGPVAGASFDLGEANRLTLLLAGELLHYSTTRSDGLYTGEYNAGRFLANVRLSGIMKGDWFFLEYGGDLRLIHQTNSGYTEFSGGNSFAHIDATNFTSLTAIGNLKLGVPMGALTPYVEGTGYYAIYRGGNVNMAGIDDILTGRLGLGVNAEVLGGTLTLRGGAYFDGDGYKGMDAGFNFSKRF
jgi:hypothetical protein